ncbi:MAG: hypothetical protein K2P21_10455 [Lachnospiraceae bacterium]|nr:hypothetical protein [Lachnospiraceae bacterium]
MEEKQRIFQLMNGTWDLEKYPVPEAGMVENEFEEGSVCSILYEEVYNANRRICERLGVEEDRDVELIIGNLLKIGEYQSMRMYDYGVQKNDGLSVT